MLRRTKTVSLIETQTGTSLTPFGVSFLSSNRLPPYPVNLPIPTTPLPPFDESRFWHRSTFHPVTCLTVVSDDERRKMGSRAVVKTFSFLSTHPSLLPLGVPVVVGVLVLFEIECSLDVHRTPHKGPSTVSNVSTTVGWYKFM